MQTPELKALLKAWNTKLEKSGFEDIEMGFPDTPNLIRPTSVLAWNEGAAKNDYFKLGESEAEAKPQANDHEKALAESRSINHISIETYYQKANVFLNNKNWGIVRIEPYPNNVYVWRKLLKTVWELHSEGLLKSEIIRLLENKYKKTKITRSLIFKIIKHFQKEMFDWDLSKLESYEGNAEEQLLNLGLIKPTIFYLYKRNKKKKGK